MTLCPKSTFLMNTSSVNSQSRNSTLKVTGMIGRCSPSIRRAPLMILLAITSELSLTPDNSLVRSEELIVVGGVTLAPAIGVVPVCPVAAADANATRITPRRDRNLSGISILASYAPDTTSTIASVGHKHIPVGPTETCQSEFPFQFSTPAHRIPIEGLQRILIFWAGPGLGKIGWHTLRHTYRSWLDQTKAPNDGAEGPDAPRGHQDHNERVRQGY